MVEPDYIMKHFDEIAEEITKKGGRAGFGAKFVSVSKVATQYYAHGAR